jgi:hypothetical protein
MIFVLRSSLSSAFIDVHLKRTCTMLSLSTVSIRPRWRVIVHHLWHCEWCLLEGTLDSGTFPLSRQLLWLHSNYRLHVLTVVGRHRIFCLVLSEWPLAITMHRYGSGDGWGLGWACAACSSPVLLSPCWDNLLLSASFNSSRQLDCEWSIQILMASTGTAWPVAWTWPLCPPSTKL